MSEMTGSQRKHINSINAVEGSQLNIPDMNFGEFMMEKLKALPNLDMRILVSIYI